MNKDDKSFIATESEERHQRNISIDEPSPETPTENIPVYEDYSEVQLTETELTSIENQLKESEKDIETSIQEIKNNPQSLYFTLFSSILFIVLCIQVSGISIINGLNMEAENRFEKTEWKEDHYLDDIKTLADLDKFLRDVYFYSIVSGTMANSTSYFAGSRFTLNMYKQVENDDSRYDKVIKTTFVDSPTSAFFNKEISTEDLDFWEYQSKKGFLNHGGYIEHFKSEDIQAFIVRWRQMTQFWLSENFANLAIETLIHNRNLKTTLLYTIEFRKGPSGYLSVFSYSSGMFYEVYENKKSTFGIIVGILVIYSIALTVQFIKLTQNLIKICRFFWSNFKFDLDFFEFIQILNVFMPMVTVIITFSLIFSNMGKYSLPLDTSGIDEMISMSRLYFSVIQVNSISCVLMMIKMTLVLRNRFPSFGVLFDTIWHAKNDLINFSIITLVLLFGFVFMGKVAFGLNHSDFRTIQGAFNALFITILSSVGYSDLKEANEQLSIWFTLMYCTLFYTILLNMFIAIVISTYIEIKSQNQLMLEAKAKIVAEDAKRFLLNIYNLIFFRTTNSLFKDCEDYLKLISVTKEEQTTEVIEKVKQLETGILQQINKNYYAIFKFNISQFQEKVGSGTLKTNEQVKIEITNVIRELFIRKKKMEKFKKIKENDVNHNFNLILRMFLFIVFTVLLLITVFARLRTPETNNLREIALNSLKKEKFDEIVSEKSFYDYVDQQLFDLFKNDSFYDHNYFFAEPLMRATINKFQISKNTNDFSKDVISEYISDNKPVRQENYRGPYTKLLYYYTKSGTLASYNKQGGYVSYYLKNTDKSQYVELMKNDRLMNHETESVVLEWVFYSSNYEMFTYCGMGFKHEPSGLILKKLEIESLNLDLFSNHYIYIGVLECFMGILCLYFTYLDLVVLFKYWKIYNLVRLEKQRGEWMVRQVKSILKQQTESKGCVKIIKTCGNLIILSILWFKDLFVQCLKSIYSTLFSSTFIIVNVTGNLLCFLLFAQLIKLFTSDLIKNYQIGEDWPNLIGEFYETSKIFLKYRLYAAFLIFITFMRFLQFYNFSKDLSVLTDVLASAKFDIFFFLAMFVIILIGYSLMGHLILGTSIYDFKSIPRSVLSCYLMLLGSFDLQAIQEADPNLGMVFFGTYIVVFYLLLLNMFTAIIGAHNEQVEKESSGQPNVGFFKKIYLTIRDAKCPRKPSKELKTTELKNIKKIDFTGQDYPDHYKKPVFDFPVSTKFFEGPEAWYNILEETLKKYSRKNIVLSSFAHIKGKKFDIFKQKYAAEIVMISPEQWIHEDIDGKIDIWRTLSDLQNKNNLLIKANSILSNSNAKISNISKILKQLWEKTSFEDKVKMWAGKNHFTDYERVSIWNSIPFSLKVFPEDKQQAFVRTWSVDSENVLWQSLTISEKLETAKKIMALMKEFYKTLKASSEFSDKFFNNENIKKLEFKELLWAALAFNHKWKLTLYLNNTVDAQADILAYLIFCEIRDSVFKLEFADDFLAEYCSASIHDKLFSECIFRAEMVRKGLIAEKYHEAEYDIKNLKDYFYELKENVDRYIKAKKELMKQNEYLQKMKILERQRSMMNK